MPTEPSIELRRPDCRLDASRARSRGRACRAYRRCLLRGRSRVSARPPAPCPTSRTRRAPARPRCSPTCFTFAPPDGARGVRTEHRRYEASLVGTPLRNLEEDELRWNVESKRSGDGFTVAPGAVARDDEARRRDPRRQGRQAGRGGRGPRHRQGRQPRRRPRSAGRVEGRAVAPGARRPARGGASLLHAEPEGAHRHSLRADAGRRRRAPHQDRHVVDDAGPPGRARHLEDSHRREDGAVRADDVRGRSRRSTSSTRGRCSRPPTTS